MVERDVKKLIAAQCVENYYYSTIEAAETKHKHKKKVFFMSFKLKIKRMQNMGTELGARTPKIV